MKIETKSGLQNTLIGILPMDWFIKKISDLGSTFSGLSGKSKEDFGSGLPYIPYKNIYQNGKIDTSFLDYVQIKPNENQHKVQFGDLFFTTSSETADEVGLTSVLLDEVDVMYLNSFCFGFRLNDFEILTPQYSVYLFRGEKMRQKISELAQGSTRFNLSKSGLLNLQIPIPPLPEQQKIAAILSTWDEAISKQKTLVEQTKKRNQGVAQQLLTGKKRLIGFDGEWKPQKIKDFALEQSIKNKENRDFVVLSCTKHNGLVPSLEYFGRQIFSENLETYKIVEKGSFAYATNHIEEGSIGYQRTFDNALISPMYTVFKTDDTIVDEFLFRLLKSHSYIHEYQKRMEGSIDRRGGLRWSEFAKIKVEVPEINEQNAINEFLEMGNKELRLLEQQLASLQNEKKGLMQKLLTGEVRVKLN